MIQNGFFSFQKCFFSLSFRIQIHVFICLMHIHSRYKGAVTWDDSLHYPTFTLTMRPFADAFTSILKGKKKKRFDWVLSCSHSYANWCQLQQGLHFINCKTKAAVTSQALMFWPNPSGFKLHICVCKCSTSVSVNKPVPWNHLHVHSSNQSKRVPYLCAPSVQSFKSWSGWEIKSCIKLTLKYIFLVHTALNTLNVKKKKRQPGNFTVL